MTKGEWKLPKHILLSITIRHLYHSKLLTTILSRLGHCETYDFGLELETALTKALNEVSISLGPQIITGEGNYVFYLKWDNLNKITTNIHGSNVVNWTDGIMIQEVKPGFDAPNSLEIQRMFPLYKRNKTRLPPDPRWICPGSRPAETTWSHTSTVSTTVWPSTREQPHRYSGVPSPMILNQCDLVDLSSPLHSLTCWRKQSRRWMEMVKKTRSKRSIMKTCCMMNRHHCPWPFDLWLESLFSISVYSNGDLLYPIYTHIWLWVVFCFVSINIIPI